jgi:hypothetical protein
MTSYNWMMIYRFTKSIDTMKLSVLFFILVLMGFEAQSQGYGYALFSQTGDTVLVRGSFGGTEKIDTVTTYFLIKAKSGNSLNRISIIKVHERRTAKHNVGYSCADFNQVSADTIEKYGFYHSGCIFPPTKGNFTVQANHIEVRDSIIGEKKLYMKQFDNTFSLMGIPFYTFPQTQMSFDENFEIEKSKITEVFYCEELDKYFIEYWLYNDHVDDATGKIISGNSRMEMIK